MYIEWNRHTDRNRYQDQTNGNNMPWPLPWLHTAHSFLAIRLLACNNYSDTEIHSDSHSVYCQPKKMVSVTTFIQHHLKKEESDSMSVSIRYIGSFTLGTALAQIRSMKSQASGPFTSSLANGVRSTTPTLLYTMSTSLSTGSCQLVRLKDGLYPASSPGKANQCGCSHPVKKKRHTFELPTHLVPSLHCWCMSGDWLEGHVIYSKQV